MSLELDRIQTTPSEEPVNDHDGASLTRSISALAPCDSGPAAWKFLFGAFMVEAVLWGFSISFGVFQEYYARQFGNDTGNIAVIGTLATSIYFLGSPFTTPLVSRYHAWQRTMLICGTALCIGALFASAFARTVPQLIVTQGALYGAGYLMLYAPLLAMLNEWFVQRRGLAYGLMFAGGGASGVGFPFLLEWLLSRYGYRTTLLTVAIAQALVMAPCMLLMKNRLPSSSRHAVPRTDTAFVKSPQFWIITLSNLFQGMAYYIPSLYLPTFAGLLGLSPRVGALLLAAHNMASTLGQVGFGHLTDRAGNIYLLLFVATFVSSISSFLIWGLAHSLAPLLVFALVFGFFGSSYIVFWPSFARMFSEDPQTVYSLMAFGKGIGNVVTGPVTSSLLKGPVSSGYGMGKYQPVVIYMGTMFLASSLGVVAWPLRRKTS